MDLERRIEHMQVRANGMIGEREWKDEVCVRDRAYAGERDRVARRARESETGLWMREGCKETGRERRKQLSVTHARGGSRKGVGWTDGLGRRDGIKGWNHDGNFTGGEHA